MLIETFEYAVGNRNEILANVNYEEHQFILRKAKELWIDFEPSEVNNVEKIGIDSSWNAIQYQGFYIYAINAVSIKENGEYFLPPVFDVGLSTLTVKSGENYYSSPELALESKGMEFEFELAKSSIGKAELVLVDGSILARYYDHRIEREQFFYETAKELMNKEGLLYVSKRSCSNIVLGGTFGDMFYFNKISSNEGFSSPIIDKCGVSVTYVRLTKGSPCLKVEIPGKIDDDQLKRLMSSLKKDTVAGYPYVLRVAHERCKISNEDMRSLANLLGLEVEIEGREVLGE